MVTPVVTYREASRRLLTQARLELEAGDVRQASEKGWGAAAQAVKAAAQQRGWIHDHHRALFTGCKRDLSNETSDPEIDILFASANYLHINFYEDALDAAKVQRHLRRTEQFIGKIEGVLDAPILNTQ